MPEPLQKISIPHGPIEAGPALERPARSALISIPHGPIEATALLVQDRAAFTFQFLTVRLKRPAVAVMLHRLSYFNSSRSD